MVTSFISGQTEGRLLCLQVLCLLLDRFWPDIHSEAQHDIRKSLASLFDEDNLQLQNWALLTLSTIAASDHTTAAADFWGEVWVHALRKTILVPLCRAACYTGHIILTSGLISPTTRIKEIETLLHNVDTQGPAYPFDSVCAFLSAALRVARSDVRLYCMGFEDRVLAWLEKWDAQEGMRGKARMDPQAPVDVLMLLNEICRLPMVLLYESPSLDFIPDCSIVNYSLTHFETRSIRAFALHGLLPRSIKASFSVASEESPAGKPATLAISDVRTRNASQLLLRKVQAFCDEWALTESHTSLPPERTRRAIDMIVLSLAFQASLDMSGVQPDQACCQAATRLLRAICPALMAGPASVAGQILLWMGFLPLIVTAHSPDSSWKLLLEPNRQSGVRQDHLSPREVCTAPSRSPFGSQGMSRLMISLKLCSCIR